MATPPDFTSGAVLTAAQMNSVGLWKVASGSLSTATTNFQGCFTSDYRDYRIVIDQVNFASAGDIYFRMLSGATPETSANYNWGIRGLYANGVSADSNLAGYTAGFTGITSAIAGELTSGSFDIFNPQVATRTLLLTSSIVYNSTQGFGGRNGFSHLNLTTAYTGIQFLTLGPTVTGNVVIYGYRK
jgi:hypothetical protein